MGTDADNVRMFRTGAHACGYWAGREARDLVLDPRDPRLPQIYPLALEWGFRRSGDIEQKVRFELRRQLRGERQAVAIFDRVELEWSAWPGSARIAEIPVVPSEREK